MPPNQEDSGDISGERAETRRGILDLVNRVSRLEGAKEHMATRDDVTNAKLSLVWSIGAMIVSIIGAIAAVTAALLRIVK